MMGNKYRKPSDTYGAVHQSITAIATIAPVLASRTGFLFGRSQSFSRGNKKLAT
jgi:hypothetical protein